MSISAAVSKKFCNSSQTGTGVVRLPPQLVLARSTVKTHVETILRKTNSHSRAAAVAWGFRTGVIK